MGKYVTFKVKESLQELKILLTKQRKPRNVMRIQSLLFLAEQRFKTRQALADYLCIHKRTMEKWLAKYEQGGISMMLIPDIVIRESKLITPQIHEALSEKLNDVQGGFSSYVEAQQWVNQKFDENITYHWIRQYMINKFKTKIKRPRKSHVNKDPKAAEAFLKTTGGTYRH